MRTPGFLVTSVGTLALAIGAVAGMFNVVNTVILKPLPFPDSDRLVVIAGTAPGSDLPERFSPGLEFYLHYKENSKLIDGIFVFGGGTSTFRTENRVERIPMAWPSLEMYGTLGVRPLLGRLPVAEDGDGVVVISHQLWQGWFGGDSSGGRQVVLRLGRDATDHRRDAARIHLPQRRDPALGGQPDLSSSRCGRDRAARR